MKVLSFFTVLFLIVVLLVSVSGEDYCGSGKFLTMTTTWTLRLFCSSRRNTINECCMKHDYCYDAQAGQEFCDDTFCECLDNAMSPETDSSCRDLTDTMCSTVRNLGKPIYEDWWRLFR
uniref:Phospholipase A(2) n=1 Tax=Steinernema glaseri TaxID=37863 RepID=A0A1I7ZH54_9BILA